MQTLSKLTLLTLLPLSMLFLACEESALSEKAVIVEPTPSIASSTKYNLRNLATQEATYQFEIASGLLRGSIKEIKSEVYELNGSQQIIMETHTELMQEETELSYRFASMHTVNEEGNVIKTQGDNTLICLLNNDVDPMPTEARIHSHSEITREYLCNNGSRYSSQWELIEDSDGEALYIIKKTLYLDDEEKESISSFKIDSNSHITTILGSTSFSGIDYDFQASPK